MTPTRSTQVEIPAELRVQTLHRPGCNVVLLDAWSSSCALFRWLRILFLNPSDRLELHGPAECRSAPDLHLRLQVGALPCGAHADVEYLRIRDIRRIDWRTTICTKSLPAFSAAFAGLHINLRLAGELEPFPFRRNYHAKG